VVILVFRAKNIPNQRIIIIIHEKIRGLILYRIQMICVINSSMANRNHSTNIHEEIIHNMSRNLLFQWYIIVEMIINEIAIAIIIKIRFGVFKLNIFEILLIT
jgi:transcription antitermination factor NusG